jgi:hypothetical protein
VAIPESRVPIPYSPIPERNPTVTNIAEKHCIFIVLRLFPTRFKPLQQKYRVILCNPLSPFRTLLAAYSQNRAVKKGNPSTIRNPLGERLPHKRNPSREDFAGAPHLIGDRSASSGGAQNDSGKEQRRSFDSPFPFAKLRVRDRSG